MSEPNNTNNVAVGRPKAGGAVFTAAIGTAVPTDAAAPLADAFENVGFCSSAGLTNGVAIQSTPIIAWGGDEVDNIVTSRAETVKLTMIETKPTSLKLIYGDENVIESGDSITVKHNSNPRPVRVWVFEIILSETRMQRIVVPNGKISAVEDITYKDGEAVQYGVTISCRPDAAGQTAYGYYAAIAQP
jgi:hypothetical protein